MRKILKMTAFLMAFVLMFSTTVFAAEPAVAPIGGDGVQCGIEESDAPQPRFPSGAFVYSIKAYAADTAKDVYYTDHYTYASFSGRPQSGSLTLNQQTRDLYEKNGCDALFVEFAFDRGGAELFDLYINGVKTDRRALGSLPAGAHDLFKLIVPVKNGAASWKVVLHNYSDTNEAGVPVSGYVRIQ